MKFTLVALVAAVAVSASPLQQSSSLVERQTCGVEDGAASKAMALMPRALGAGICVRGCASGLGYCTDVPSGGHVIIRCTTPAYCTGVNNPCFYDTTAGTARC